MKRFSKLTLVVLGCSFIGSISSFARDMDTPMTAAELEQLKTENATKKQEAVECSSRLNRLAVNSNLPDRFDTLRGDLAEFMNKQSSSMYCEKEKLVPELSSSFTYILHLKEGFDLTVNISEDEPTELVVMNSLTVRMFSKHKAWNISTITNFSKLLSDLASKKANFVQILRAVNQFNIDNK